jgi:hypothetical protein
MVKTFLRIMLAALGSIGIAAALSLVPRLDGSLAQGNDDKAVFRQEEAVTLTSRNLVDFMAKQPLSLDIGRVEWTDPILSIDLKTKKSGIGKEDIYRDLFQLSRFALVGTKNVKQLLIRVVDANENGAVPQLIVALDAKREQMERLKQNMPQLGKLDAERALNSYFSLTFTRKWLDRYER